MNRVMSFALALAVSASIYASPAQADSRLVEVMYDPDSVVRINGRTRVQATIKFAEDEMIENVAIGDSQSWQVTPNKRANLLFVKPLSATASTNMTVVTNRHTYLFDLVASPRNKPLYVLSFAYPEEPEDEAALAAADAPAPESANAMELTAASDPYAVVDPTALNFEWIAEGEPTLLPARTYDDGNATFMSWPQAAAVPAILIEDHEGTEGPVNFTVRGDTVVVDGVPSKIILRSGDERAILTNQGPARDLALAAARD